LPNAAVLHLPVESGIFKFHLYKKMGTNTYEGSPAHTFDGVSSTYNPISRGQGENIATVTPGYYKLKVVAGSYPWQSYTDGISIGSAYGSDATHWRLIDLRAYARRHVN
jgi:hypothetical protein